MTTGLGSIFAGLMGPLSGVVVYDHANTSHYSCCGHLAPSGQPFNPDGGAIF